MCQFKGIFLNYYDSPAMKVTNSQKCIRVSGKHNDLNIVGSDTYHHTFFEMLGNWSFGSYFKEEACTYAWDLLTNHYGINKEFLYVTYFGGNEKLRLEPDIECKDIWLSIGVPKEKVLPFGLQENFWEMGISGPCGPSTEIHVDHTRQLANRSMQINKGLANLTELWNIVFIQYIRLENGTITPLSKQYVDTGMGFERLVAFLQEKDSNYDTDIFQPLFKAIQRYANVPEYGGKFYNDKNELDSAYRILADHSRMITVALTDGMVPEESNKLRKIIRKSVDVSENVFKKQGLLLELSYIVAESLGDTYPELHDNLGKVQKIIAFEEELYKKLQCTTAKRWEKLCKVYPQSKLITDWLAPGLVDGYKYLQCALNNLEITNVLPGDIAFKLYDTYGLSVKTIKELAKVESLHFDEEALQKELESLKNRSRIGLESNSVTTLRKCVKIFEKKGVPKTDDTFKYEYVYDGNSYQFPKIESKITGVIVNDNIILTEANESVSEYICSTVDETIRNYSAELNEDDIGIILDKTLCYSVEGGQTSDKGFIWIKDLIFNINNVRKIDGYVIHYGKFLQSDLKKWTEELKIGDNCLVSIVPEFRIGLMEHHTGAHLLNACIKQIMKAVYTRNSSILSDSLKIQYNAFGEKLSLEQLKEIEKVINNVIKANVPITTKVLNSLELLAENSVTLTPGEIYPYTNIRIVKIDFDHLKSKEACCGTHVSKTGMLEYFCFLKYSSKGVSNLTVKGVVGSHAKIAKLAGERLQSKLLDLENKLKIEKFTYKAFKSISKEIENEIKNGKGMLIPYVIKEECLMKLNFLSKLGSLQAKEVKK
ncbi:Alanine--tRNA ligase, mitochondrial [Anthophora plagiata]